VVQLQLLDLMISRECGAVPMDAATRAALIDLMARTLVAVFHEEGIVWAFHCQAVSERRSLFLPFLIGFFVRSGIPFLRPDPQYCKS
jgi:hypothetical protein